jgi:hypothetical protein
VLAFQIAKTTKKYANKILSGAYRGYLEIPCTLRVVSSTREMAILIIN